MKRIMSILAIVASVLYLTACGGESVGSGNTIPTLSGKTVYSISESNVANMKRESTLSFDTHIETVHMIMKNFVDGTDANGNTITLYETIIDDIYPITDKDENIYYFEGRLTGIGLIMEIIVNTSEITNGYVTVQTVIGNNLNTLEAAKYYFSKNDANANSIEL